MGVSVDSHNRECKSLTNVKQAGDKLTGVKTIADRTKEARERLGWTQPELAKRAGVAPGTIGNIEAGTRKNPRELLAIAAALGVNPQWLKSGEGPEGASQAAQSIQPAQTMPTLALALERLGMALATEMPEDVRQDVADLLGKLALRNGAERHQRELAELLSAAGQSSKRLAA
jgi:transcriptional regulator with XRE-family HTH domain